MSVPTSSPDFVTIATNIGVFFVMVGTVITSIWASVKKIKSSQPEDEATAPGTKLIGGAILDNHSMLMWSESNRIVAEKLHEMTDALRDNNKEMMELRFAMTRLLDKGK